MSVEDLANSLRRAYDLRETDPSAAFRIAETVYQEAEGDEANSAEIHLVRAQSQAILSEYYSSISENSKAIAIGKPAITLLEAANDKIYLPLAINSVGRAYFQLNNIQEMENHFTHLLNWSKENNDLYYEANAHIGLGHLLEHRGQYEAAIQHEKASLEIYRRLGDLFSEARTLQNIGVDLGGLGQTEQALVYYLQAFQLCTESDSKKLKLLQILVASNIALAYISLDEIEEAKTYIKFAQNMISGQDAPRENLFILNCQATLLEKAGENQKAIAIHKKIIKTAGELKFNRFVIEHHLALARIFKKLGDLEKALYHTEEHFRRQVEELKSDREAKLTGIQQELEAEKQLSKELLIQQKTAKLTQAVEEQTSQLRAVLERERNLSRRLQNSLDKNGLMKDIISQMIQLVSHEFRNPLAIIGIKCQIIKMKGVKMADEDLARIINDVEQSTADLTDLVRTVESINQIRNQASETDESAASVSTLYDLIANLKNDLSQSASRISVTRSKSLALDAPIEIELWVFSQICRHILQHGLEVSQGHIIISAESDTQHLFIKVIQAKPTLSPTKDHQFETVSLSLAKKLVTLTDATLSFVSFEGKSEIGGHHIISLIIPFSVAESAS